MTMSLVRSGECIASQILSHVQYGNRLGLTSVSGHGCLAYGTCCCCSHMASSLHLKLSVLSLAPVLQHSPAFNRHVSFITSRIVLVEHIGKGILCPCQAVHMHPFCHARFTACYGMQAAICAFGGIAVNQRASLQNAMHNQRWWSSLSLCSALRGSSSEF